MGGDLTLLACKYHIAGNFDGGNFDIFDVFQPDHQNLTCQTFKAIQGLVKDSDHPSKYFPSKIFEKSLAIHQNFPRQNFPLYGIRVPMSISRPTMLLCWDHDYLITVDYHTGRPDITPMTLKQYTTALQQGFCRTAIPDIIWSDGGPQFTFSKFNQFSQHWGCLHKISSPYHP